MATGITKVPGVFCGTGEPDTEDVLCEDVVTYPLNTVYINTADGAVFIRKALNKVQADWESTTAFAAGNPTLDTPTLYAETVDDDKVNLSWSAVDKATNYVVERDTADTFDSPATEIYNGALGNFQDSGLTAATQYFYRVKAEATGYDDSAWGEADATTDAAP